MTELALLGIAVALIAACAMFVAGEFSLTTVDPGALGRAAESGERGASTAERVVKRLTFHLSGAQLGITLASLVIGMLAEPSASALLRGPLEAAGLSTRAAETTALVLAILISTVALMVFGELVPKNWAISRPLQVAKVVARPLHDFSAAFAPLIDHLNNTANWFVRQRDLEPVEHLGVARSPQELIALARHSSKQGAIDPETAELFVRALQLRRLTAQHLMTPRVDVKAVEAGATALDVANLTRLSGLSQFPVYDGTIDNVVGTVHLKAVLRVPADRRSTASVLDLMTEPKLVPETISADRLLDLLREHDTLAVVLDEYGDTVGIVSLEDVIEEVIGSVSDEHDVDDRERLIELDPSEDGRARWQADGLARTDQLEGLGLPAIDGPYETLAGLIAHRLDRIPTPGDRIEISGWTLHVDEVAHHVADRVEITGPLPSAGDHPGGDDRDQQR